MSSMLRRSHAIRLTAGVQVQGCNDVHRYGAARVRRGAATIGETLMRARSDDARGE